MAVKKTPELEPEHAPPTKGGSFLRRKDGSLQEIPPRTRPAPPAEPASPPPAPAADSNT
jgi:hypothetical protein